MTSSAQPVQVWYSTGTAGSIDGVPVTQRKPIIPPIFVEATSWWHITETIFLTPSLFSDTKSVKITSDGQSMINTINQTKFQLIQKILLDPKTEFTYAKLANKPHVENRPTWYSYEYFWGWAEIRTRTLNFDIKIVKRLGLAKKPMAICILIFANNKYVLEIYNLNELLFFSISAESYK